MIEIEEDADIKKQQKKMMDTLTSEPSLLEDLGIMNIEKLRNVQTLLDDLIPGGGTKSTMNSNLNQQDCRLEVSRNNSIIAEGNS